MAGIARHFEWHHGAEEDDIEMEECVPTTAIENGDPDSRDSGISVGGLSITSNCNSPPKKKQRQTNGRVQLPTDFSFLQQNQFSANTSSTLLNSELIPPMVRSVHRVHSDSVLELSNRSWGSPDATLEHYSLLTVDRPQVPSRAFRSIDSDTIVHLLESLTEEQFIKRFILIDCRYPYEFTAGHIWYSENIFRVEEIIKVFYPEDDQQFQEMKQRIPIFYCEFSQKRGPRMAMALREHDRNQNENRYPFVDYKEIYLLDRGYRHFFKERQLLKFCQPPAYVPMWDRAYSEERKQFEGHRRNQKRRLKK